MCNIVLKWVKTCKTPAFSNKSEEFDYLYSRLNENNFNRGFTILFL